MDEALWRKLQELGLSSKYRGGNGEFSRWFRLFIGLAFVPAAHAMTAYQLIVNHYTPSHPACLKFNDYFLACRNHAISG